MFRIQRRQTGMTWRCPTNAEENPIPSKEDIKDCLTDKFGPATWTVCEELHENGKKDYHAHFFFVKMLETENPHCFDLHGVHPIIQNGGPNWENYVRRQGEFITNKSCVPGVCVWP